MCAMFPARFLYTLITHLVSCQGKHVGRNESNSGIYCHPSLPCPQTERFCDLNRFVDVRLAHLQVLGSSLKVDLGTSKLGSQVVHVSGQQDGDRKEESD
jgi:hypothetical protein